MLLWRDKLGQISLATTTLFWGAGATLKFIVLAWAASALGFDLSQASYLQGVVAVGIALGAVIAAKMITLRRAVSVLPIGAAMGLIVIMMVFVTQLPVAIVLMILIGGCAGFFVVPMNALLQHRGHVLMGAGHSIAVQNFNENIGILVMVGLYAFMIGAGISVNVAIVFFGVFVSGTMLLVLWRHLHNQSKGDSLHLIAEEGDGRHH
jgi:MFS family permease